MNMQLNITYVYLCQIQYALDLLLGYCFLVVYITFLFDGCSSDPCVNGGSCSYDGNTYICACISGYTGEDCEIGMCYLTKTLFTLYVLMGNMVCCTNISSRLCLNIYV